MVVFTYSYRIRNSLKQITCQININWRFLKYCLPDNISISLFTYMQWPFGTSSEFRQHACTRFVNISGKHGRKLKLTDSARKWFRRDLNAKLNKPENWHRWSDWSLNIFKNMLFDWIDHWTCSKTCLSIESNAELAKILFDRNVRQTYLHFVLNWYFTDLTELSVYCNG